MKKIVYFLLISLGVSNCTHRIVRTGYEVDKSDYRQCEIIIKRDLFVSDSLSKKVGEIKIGETGFSVACSEAHAINILKNEACAIQADFINITEENRPNLVSSCYRCKASFYKYNSALSILVTEKDEAYKSENVQKRVNNDRNNNTTIIIGSIMAGFIFGILLFL